MPFMVKKRTILTINEKREIYQFGNQNKILKHEELAKYFSKKFDKTISRQVVDNIMKKEEELIDGSNEKKRKMPVQDERIETTLFHWIGVLNNKGIPVSDKMVQEQAKKVATKLEMKDFKASNGWLAKFKKRNKLKSYSLCGETGGIKEEDIEIHREHLKNQLKEFKKCDIYNLDETGLFFRYSPSKTIHFESIKGRKKIKERITILLCTNADGSDKRKPLVIGKYINPRCFKNFNVEAFVEYRNNGKAWLTSKEYEQYIRKFDAEMREKKRNVVLIVDNAPGHKILETTNVKIIFLPPNLTGFLQPLDAGIIRSFKALYRHQQMSFLVDILNDQNVESESNNLFKLITLKEAIIFVRQAWNNVTVATINNCWEHTNILFDHNSTEKILQEEINQEITCYTDEINQMLSLISINTNFTANDLVNIAEEDEISEELNGHDLTDIVENVDEKDQNDDISEKNMIDNKIITINQARGALEILKNYFFQSDDCNNFDLNYLEHFTVRLRKDLKKTRQTKITDWINIIKK